MARKIKETGFEEYMTSIEQILARLEDENTTLSEAVKLYKDGLDLCLACSDNLKTLEQEVTVVTKTTRGLVESLYKKETEDDYEF